MRTSKGRVAKKSHRVGRGLEEHSEAAATQGCGRKTPSCLPPTVRLIMKDIDGKN